MTDVQSNGPVDVNVFVDEWIAAWNARDVEGVLAHFTDDVVFSSPVAKQVLEGSDGVLRGKSALREYWLLALSRVPDLHFELVGVYVGVGVIAINFRNQLGKLANEILIFEGELVVQGYGSYLDQ